MDRGCGAYKITNVVTANEQYFYYTPLEGFIFCLFIISLDCCAFDNDVEEKC